MSAYVNILVVILNFLIKNTRKEEGKSFTDKVVEEFPTFLF